MTLYSASSGTYLEHFPKIITIAYDGSGTVFTEEIVSEHGTVEMKVGDDGPTIKNKISAEKVNEIKQVIEKNRFHSIPKNVTDYDVMDGDGSKIIVYEKKGKREIGGENSSHDRYNVIEAMIFNQVKDDYYDWVKEMEDYLIKLNE